MNYKNKNMLYKVQNITVKYSNFRCADATKPVRQNKLTPCYKMMTMEWKNYSKIKKTRLLPSTQDDKLQSDYRVSISRGGFHLVAGKAITTDGWFLIWIEQLPPVSLKVHCSRSHGRLTALDATVLLMQGVCNFSLIISSAMNLFNADTAMNKL
jgi:hypothetical protein